MPSRTAREATGTSALRWLGATTIASTRRLTKSSTMLACPVRSVSAAGAVQIMSTFSSAAHRSAPARTLCQKTCAWPLGTTAIVVREARRPEQLAGRRARATRAMLHQRGRGENIHHGGHGGKLNDGEL